MTEYVRTYWIFGVGFTAQALFALRIIVQWWVTERRKQVMSPNLFWELSLAGSAVFLIYGLLRLDIVIILGQLIAYLIYIRNLQLKQIWTIFPALIRMFILAVPVSCIVWLLDSAYRLNYSASHFEGMQAFLWIGIAGQALLNLRFVYQLYYSERIRKSTLPTGFWWISLAGSILVVIYAIYRYDPVLLVAQSLATIPYTRNILLSQKAKGTLTS